MAQAGNRTWLYVLGGLGCAGLSGLCCLVAAAFALPMQMRRGGADAYASRFMGPIAARDFRRAFTEAEHAGDSSLYGADAFAACLAATPLGDVTSYACDPASVGPFDDRARVVCHVVSATHGATDITLDVNSPDEMPYLGFVWLAPGAFTGPAWHGDSCARWSGRDFVDDPPADRVRP